MGGQLPAEKRAGHGRTGAGAARSATRHGLAAAAPLRAYATPAHAERGGGDFSRGIQIVGATVEPGRRTGHGGIVADRRRTSHAENSGWAASAESARPDAQSRAATRW